MEIGSGLTDGATIVISPNADLADGPKGRIAKVRVLGPYPDGSASDFEVRFFAAAIGIDEDPVTGSLNANLARWLIDTGRAPAAYVAAQGTAMGRAGRVHVARVGADTWIGGDVTPLIHGQVRL